MTQTHSRVRRTLRRNRRAAGALPTAALACTLAAPAAAAPARHPVELEAEAANVLTFKFAVLEAIAPAEESAESMAEPMMVSMPAPGHEVVSHVGLAFSFERSLWPGGLAAELNVVLSPGEGGLTLPSELLLKKVFPLSTVAEPFAGLGLAAEWWVAGEYEPQYGLASDLGAYFWLERSFGLVVETEYSLFFSRETEHELALAAGGALRF